MPDEVLNYVNDHDLLIDMRRILLDLREDFRDVKMQTDSLSTDVTVLKIEWGHFKGVGKYLWAGVTGAVAVLVNAGIHYLWR